MKERARAGLLQKIQADVAAGLTPEEIDAKYPAYAQ
jgi:hypothetical protein